MKVSGVEVGMPLVALRTILGDTRVEELQGQAAELLYREKYSVDELLCFAEFFRLMAEGRAEIEVMKLMRGED
jgi:hypothetical protein